MKKTTTHIVCFSGGHSSAIAAIEVSRRYGINNLVLLNHDVPLEDADVKRFKNEVAAYIGLPVTYANMKDWQSKDQFQVAIEASAFKVSLAKVICTSRLKTEPFYKYIEENHPKKDCVIYYGFDASETKRIQRRGSILAADGWKSGYPLIWKNRTISSTEEVGIKPPLLYSVFRHANCIGCIKAKRQHWYVVYCNYPEIFERAKWAESEIGHTILPDISMEDIEPLFAKMKVSGVPATERIQHGTFWAAAKKSILDLPLLQPENEMPCECVV